MGIKHQINIVLFFLLFLGKQNLHAQAVQVINQESFEQIHDLQFSPDGQQFLTFFANGENVTFKLWDANSKLMIGKKTVFTGMTADHCQPMLKDNGELWFHTAWSVEKYNFFTRQSKTLFEINLQKELSVVIGYWELLPDQILVLIKSYKEGQAISDVTNNFRMTLFQPTQNKILTEKQIHQEIIEFLLVEEKFFLLNEQGHGFFLNKGLEADTETIEFPLAWLWERNEYNFHLRYDKTGNRLIFNQAVYGKAPRVKNTLHVYNLKEKTWEKEILIPTKERERTDVMGGKSKYGDDLKTLLLDEASHSLIAVVGYNAMYKISIEEGRVEDKSIPDFDEGIGAIVLNPKSDEALIAYGDRPGQMVRFNPKLALVDLDRQKILARVEQDFDVVDDYFQGMIKIGEEHFLYRVSSSERNQNYFSQIKFKSLDLLSKISIDMGNHGFLIPNQGDDQMIFLENPPNSMNGLIWDSIQVGSLNPRLIHKELDFSRTDFDNSLLFDYSEKYLLTHLEDWKKFKGFDQFELLYFNTKEKVFCFRFFNRGGSVLAFVDTTGKLLNEIPVKESFDFKTLQQGNYFVFSHKDYNDDFFQLGVFDLPKRQLIYHQTLKEKEIISLDFDFQPIENKLYLSASFDGENDDLGKIFKLDFTHPNAKPETVYQGDIWFRKMALIPDKSQIIGYNYGHVYTLDYTNGKVKQDLEFRGINTLKIYPDKGLLLFSGKGNPTTILNLENNKSVHYYSYGQNVFAQNNEGYYTSFEYLSNNIAFLTSRNAYPLAQFDLQFNRPDRVFEGLQQISSTRQKLFAESYQKRLKSLNLSAQPSDLSSLPKVEIVSEIPPFQTDQEILPLDIKITKGAVPMKSWNVWVNGIPQFGAEGEPINSDDNSFLKKAFIPLSSGENRIEVEAMDKKGRASLREIVKLHRTGTINGRTIYIGLGVAAYQNADYNLTYPTKDVKDLSLALKNQFPNLESHLFLDRQVTISTLEEIKKILKNTSVNDKVIISVHGHGLLGANNDFYFGSYDIDFDKPEEKGISYEQLVSLFDDVPVRQRLLLIDACHSGELDTDLLPSEGENTIALSDAPANARGAIVVSTQTKDQQEEQWNSFVLKQKLFSNALPGNGTTVLSASAGMELAFEGKGWQNGVFTYVLLQTIKGNKADLNADGKTTISELKNYMSNEVSRLTNGQQIPNTVQENRSTDFVIW